MKTFHYTLLIIFVLNYTNCSTFKKGDNDLRSINLIHKWDLVTVEDGQLISASDTLTIYYFQNLVLYKIPYTNEVSNVTTDKNGDVIDEKLMESETKYKYFIYEKDSSFGFKYDSINAKNNRRFSIDSFLTQKAFKGASFYQRGNDTMIASSWNEDKSVLIEKYIPKIKFDQSYNDTSYLYFTSSLKKVDYSFSKELDSSKNMKLFKVRFINNPLPRGVYSFDVPRREMMFEIRETPVTDSNEIIRFFERFKKCCVQK